VERQVLPVKGDILQFHFQPSTMIERKKRGGESPAAEFGIPLLATAESFSAGMMHFMPPRR
jgi:hypothetical protein